jgi:hypothetical protein
LQRAFLGGREPDQLARLLLVGEDRGEVTVGEPAGVRARPQRTLDLVVAVELGEVNCFCHLATNPGSALSGGGDQPGLGAITEGQELPLLDASRPWASLERPGWSGWIVLV